MSGPRCPYCGASLAEPFPAHRRWRCPEVTSRMDLRDACEAAGLPRDAALHVLLGAVQERSIAAFLASPEAAEGLARALHEQLGHTALSLMCCDRLAAAILAAWQQERAK